MEGLSQMTGGNFLHSIFLTNKTDSLQELPSKIKKNIDSFVAAHEGARHVLYTNDTLRAFIESKFDSDVIFAYDELVPLAYKADLGRYCLLYELGGVYSDLSIYFFNSFFGLDHLEKLYTFRDASSGAPWIVSNSIIAAPPKAKVFENCIKKIVQHTKNHYYGENALCPTGPHLFGAELAKSTKLGDIVCGETIRLPSRNGIHNFAYVSKENEFFAINYKRGYGLSTLGAKTQNNYAAAYNRREIYASAMDSRAFKNRGPVAAADIVFTADTENAIINSLARVLDVVNPFLPEFLVRLIAEFLCTVGKKIKSPKFFNLGGSIFVYLDVRKRLHGR